MGNILVQLCEIAATYVEVFLLYGFYDLFFPPRIISKKWFILLKQISIVAITIFITIANQFSIFSYVTFFATIILCSFTALITYRLKIVSLKSVSILPVTALYYFGVLFLDFFLVSILTILFDVFTIAGLVFSADNHRMYLVVITKLVSIVIYKTLKIIIKTQQLKLKPQYVFYLTTITTFLAFLTVIVNNALWDSYLMTHKYVFVIICFLFIAIYVGVFWMSISFTMISDENEMIKINRLKYKNLQNELDTLTQSNIAKSKILHDTKNHIFTIRELIKKNQIDVLESYLQEYAEQLSRVPNYIKTGSDIIDVILNNRISEARKQGIDVECITLKLDNIDLNPMDMCSILTNLLDNAIEACSGQTGTSSKHIQVEIKRKHDFLYIKISNTAQTPPNILKGCIQTSKSDSSIHGFGLQIVQDCVQKYMGAMSFSYEQSTFMFTVFVTLCLEQMECSTV